MILVAILNCVIIIVGRSDSWSELGNCLSGALRIKDEGFLQRGSPSNLQETGMGWGVGHRVGFRQVNPADAATSLALSNPKDNVR